MEPLVSENPIQPMIRDLVFLSPLHPTLGATERRNLGTDVLAPISFLPWWDDAAQCQAFDLIRGMIEILVPFTSVPQCGARRSLTDRTGGAPIGRGRLRRVGAACELLESTHYEARRIGLTRILRRCIELRTLKKIHE